MNTDHNERLAKGARLKPQWAAILQRLSDGDTLAYGRGIRSSGNMYWGSFHKPNPNTNTVMAMADDKFRYLSAEDDKVRWWKVNYTITEVGSAALHHHLHGDMDGKTCLLNKCALHYPEKD